MALTIAERIAQVAEHIANHASHGYSQNNRAGDGTTETVKLSDGSTVTIHGGDYDCSEMARVCVNAAISGSYTSPIASMWSGNADTMLKAQGFTRIAFSSSKVQRGDTLWKVGHMGIAVGSGKQADAHGDEVGGITGPTRGDQTGHEIEVRSLRTNWTYIYRKEEAMKADSSLVTSTVWTSKHSGTRTHAIDTITPHYIVGYVTGESCAKYLRDTPSRTASANYFIGYAGDVCQSVPEAYRSWCSSSAANDQRAITIECANYMDTKGNHVYGQLPDKTWTALVNLCADICKRLGKKGLQYVGSADYSKLKSGYMLLTMHKWFASTDCPGPWLSTQFAQLAKEVNAKLEPAKQVPGDAVNDLGLKYRAHVQSLGWCDAVHDGQTAGTTGASLRMEALKITPPEGVTLDVVAHIQGVGDKAYKGIRKGKSSGTGTSANDPIIGTVGKSKRLEALTIDVAENTNAKLKGKTLYYRAHVQGIGWQAWKKAGQMAGTKGKSRRIEAVQMKFV